MNMCPQPKEAARFIGFALVCGAVVMGTALYARSFDRGTTARVALAVVQGFATGAVIIGSVLRLRRLDEMQQRVHLEALAIAFTGTGVLGTAYGFLVSAGLPDIEWGTLVWPVMAALWAIGLLVANRRYR
jgi:hypothetical protein